jgi:hypothetical protein
MADHDGVLANQNLLDDQAHDALTLHDIKCVGILSKPGEKRCERLGQAQTGVAIARSQPLSFRRCATIGGQLRH